ncbi:universal stress protein [Paroceanicella profunda]|uniref:Universal stress protein n=1 Tax=Paroceanicella profunda TaxID=2579971 RepID=A0A5B8FGM2_9RHOB|nr:universal stress protein [Paroceanicella profunda]QDL91048.1 universal stress protein [Paroceanicella profunda]
MTQETFVVAYSGDDMNVVDYASERAQKAGARLFLVHVLEWSPYSFLTPEELEQRHVRRREELSRAHSAVLDPVLKLLADKGIPAEGEIRYGSVVDLVIETVKKLEATMVFVGRTTSSSMSARVFGTVSLGLAQAAPVPTVIVP